MNIQEGFDDKPTSIKISGRPEVRKAEVWIEQLGMPDFKETLAYATLDELLDLKAEVAGAIEDIVNG